MVGKSKRLVMFLVLGLLLLPLLVACGDDATSTTNNNFTFQQPTPTITPPFVAAPIQTPSAAPEQQVTADVPPTPTMTPLPPTPIVAPTPTVPRETLIGGDDLGIGVWNDTQISWSPQGNQYLLQAGNQNDPLNFYFLIRPPSSVVASYKLSRSAFGTFAWSPDNRYLSFIQQDADGNAGPVKIIDTQSGAYQPVEVFRGPCTGATWLSSGVIVAACGTAVYSLTVDLTKTPQPESLFKLDEQSRFPGSPVTLTIIARALPSPDGKTLALFGLQTAVTGKVPIGEIGFLDLETKKFSVLDRNDRPVAPVDWTPNSKGLILRNLTADWTVGYTFDFYLGDLTKLKITTNLSKSNPKCDPVLGKTGCQGTQPSTFQTAQISFAPDGNRYFVTGRRYVPRPNVGLQTAERLFSGTVNDGKLTQLIEHPAGGRIAGLTWLPNNHYFYTFIPDDGGAKAYLDGKAQTITLSPSLRPGTTPAPTTRAALEDGSVIAFAMQVTTTSAAPPISTTVVPTSAVSSSAAPVTTDGTPAVPVTSEPPVAPIKSPISVEIPIATPAGTTLPLPTPVLLPTVKSAPVASPTPKISKDRVVNYGYFVSPTGNWLISLEKISEDKPLQYQLRLIPFSLK